MAVEIVNLGHDDNSGESAAYSVRGTVEAKSGEFAAADEDLSKAEDYERKAIAWANSVKFEHLDSYTDALNQNLRVHFQLLQAMGRPDEAKKKLAESPDSQSTESDETLLTKAHGLYDAPFTRSLVSFNCAAQFDWKNTLSIHSEWSPRLQFKLSSIFKLCSIGSSWTALELWSRQRLKRLTFLEFPSGLI
jgi:hypothetical protein